MSPLERAARALRDLQSDDGLAGSSQVRYEPDAAGRLLPNWESHLPIVRAVLQAIREPSESMIYANSEGGLGFNDRVVLDWQAMIDAALEEG